MHLFYIKIHHSAQLPFLSFNRRFDTFLTSLATSSKVIIVALWRNERGFPPQSVGSPLPPHYTHPLFLSNQRQRATGGRKNQLLCRLFSSPPPTSKPPPPHASLTTTAEVEEIGREDDERKKGEGGGNPSRRRHLEKCEHTPNNRKIPPRFPPPKQSADGGRGEKTRARTKYLKVR